MGKTISTKGAATLADLDALLERWFYRQERAEERRRARRGGRMRRMLTAWYECADAIERLGGGLRAEEIAAATGRKELVVWRALEWATELGYVENRGDRGWFFVEPEREAA